MLFSFLEPTHLYKRKQCEHSTKQFIFCGKEKKNHTGLEQNEGEQITEFKCLDELSLEAARFTSVRERERKRVSE